MQQAAIPVRDDYLCTGGMQIDDGQSYAAMLLQLEDPPTAIIASDSKLLLGLLRVMRERHLLAPRT